MSSSTTGSHWDARRYVRHRVDIPVRARVFVGESLDVTLSGRCRELGRGGLGVHLKDPLSVGETALIELSDSATAYGVVRYVKGSYHGFEFTLLQHAAGSWVDRLCEEYEQQPQN